jgi:hypothetical protein
MKSETFTQAIREARLISLRAANWASGREKGTILEAPDAAMACIQGNADLLAWMLQNLQDQQECRLC